MLTRLFRGLNQRGDTLIEVTIALTILSMVLTGSTVVATRAFSQGQTAKERTVISTAAQAQMEALRAFRDNHSWDQFLHGSTAGTPYSGVLGSFVGPTCQATTPCLHMAVPGGGPGAMLPAGGSMTGEVPTSWIEISVTPDASTPPQSVDVVVSYGFDNLGGGATNVGHIKTTLTNVAFAVATPVPTPPPSGGGSGLADATSLSCVVDPITGVCPPYVNPNPPQYYFDQTYTNTSDTGGLAVLGCTWDWGDGTIPDTISCNPGDINTHGYSMPGLPPYPAACGMDPFTLTLTVKLSNGTSPVKKITPIAPKCY